VPRPAMKPHRPVEHPERLSSRGFLLGNSSP
jgi:hypothetical protein